MKKLEILTYPDARLRQESSTISNWSDDLYELVENMRYTMETNNNDAVGLSAIQVGIPLRLFVAKISGHYKLFINPRIIESYEQFGIQEGCLSFPGIFDLINRSKYIKVEYQTNPTGQFPHAAQVDKVIDTFKDLDAIIIQHELDHLNGVLMYDYFTPQYQKRIDKKIKKGSFLS